MFKFLPATILFSYFKIF